MSSSNQNCLECGTALPLGYEGSSCPKCLLAVGLGKSTVIRTDAEAVTLPPKTPSELANSSSMAAVNPAYVDDGQGIGAYRNLEAVHDWSGGTVYKAYHPGLDRPVLLRVLESSADATVRQEFLTRAETLSQLNHPNTVATLEAGEDAGVAYVAEEWVDGKPIAGFLPRTWRERWREGFFPGREIMKTMRDAALGLQAIHKKGLAHGRLNPDSVVIDGNGMVRLIGLGEASDATDDRFAGPQTMAENPVAADIYRLGATFFFLVTGKLPTEVEPTPASRPPTGTTPASSTLTQRLKRLNPYHFRALDQTHRGTRLVQQLKRLNPGLCRGFRQIIARCLDQEGSFYESAEDVVDALNRLLKRRVTRARWRPRFYSMFLEGFCLMLLFGLVQNTLAPQYVENPNQRATFSMIFMFTVPFVYAIVFESLVGWTPVRRLFGLRLLNHAGERSSWRQRLARAILKFLLFYGSFFAPALVLPLIKGTSFNPLSWVILSCVWMLSPLYLMYLPARWIPSRWTYYDLLAGVTWAEESQVTFEPVVHHQTDVTITPQSTVVDRIDQYDIHETLGTGGMGCVYRAHDRILGRDVAIKVLAGHLVRDPLLLERFQREARLAAKVSHPNVAKVFGNGIWNATPYIAMEFVHGRNLQEIIHEKGRLSVETAWKYLTQAAEALRAADRNGVVHRDIKPANLMIAKEGQLKVTDFGVSRQTVVDVSVTKTGTIVGTPAYMAPEQAMGKDVDCRCDIYALGMTLYHMLAGRAPFQGANAVEILAQQMAETPPSLLGEVDQLTPGQNEVLLKMIAKKPEDRHGSYDTLLSDLRRYAPGVDRLASPIKRLAAETCNWVGFYFFFTFAMASLWLFGRQLGMESGISGTAAVGWVMFAFIAAVMCVYLVATARSGATLGKKLLGMRVVRLNGQRVGYGRAALRFLAAYPLFVVCVPVILISLANEGRPMPYSKAVTSISLAAQVVVTVGSLILLWTHSKRRTVHDLVSGTMVVREEA